MEKSPVFSCSGRYLLVVLSLDLGSLTHGALLLLLLKDRAGRDDNVPVLGVELLSPDQAGSVLLGALVDDGVRVLSNSLDLDGDWLWVLWRQLLAELKTKEVASGKTKTTHIVTKLDASALMLVTGSQINAVSASTIDSNDSRAVGSSQGTENGSELVSGPGLSVVAEWLILSAADNSAL